MGIIFAKQPDPLPRESFGPRLRDLRVRCGITMGELARVRSACACLWCQGWSLATSRSPNTSRRQENHDRSASDRTDRG